MAYNLTENQNELVRWIVQEARVDRLPKEFRVHWLGMGGRIQEYQGDHPAITEGALDALAASDLIISEPSYRTVTSSSRSKLRGRQTESSRRCTLTGKAYEAVGSDFDAPDTSFLKQLTPLADLTNLDDEFKDRILPILSAGGANPKIWDSAVRTAGVILEERLRDVAGITDSTKKGRALVNMVFGQHKGLLIGKFSDDSDREGYRDLYAGIVGTFRNPSAHTFVDPTPEDGGVLIVFVNLLLKRLEDLR